MITLAPFNALAGYRHAFFARTGGVSEGIYASRNCGPGSGDAPGSVRRNRARCLADLGVPEAPLLTLHQIHSAEVVTVEEPWSDDVPRPRADAAVTDRRGVVLGILTADCAPVLFIDVEAGVIGAAHAGWKGALAGVLEATVDAMTALGAKRARIAAAIGPCIAQRSYEVGPEFRQRLLDADTAMDYLVAPSGRSGHWLFDLPGYAARRLSEAGVETVYQTRHDTAAESDRFFSYRRACLAGEPDYGRQLSAIARL